MEVDQNAEVPKGGANTRLGMWSLRDKIADCDIAKGCFFPELSVLLHTF